MSYTNDLKEQWQETFTQWVEDNKHDEMNCYFCGDFNKDNYETRLEQYIEQNEEELWNEFAENLPEGDKDKWADYNDEIKSGLSINN